MVRSLSISPLGERYGRRCNWPGKAGLPASACGARGAHHVGDKGAQGWTRTNINSPVNRQTPLPIGVHCALGIAPRLFRGRYAAGSPDHRRNLWTRGRTSANAGRLCRNDLTLYNPEKAKIIAPRQRHELATGAIEKLNTIQTFLNGVRRFHGGRSPMDAKGPFPALPWPRRQIGKRRHIPVPPP